MTPTPRTPGVEGEGWRDMADAPHGVPILAQYHEWNDPTRPLAEHVVWFYDDEWRPYPLVENSAYADRWMHLPDTVSTDPEAGTKSEGRSEPDLSQAIKERDEARAELEQCKAGRRMVSSGAMDLGAMHCAVVAERDEAVRLLRRIARVYGDIQDGNGNTPTEIRKVSAFLTTMEKRCG